MKAKHAKLLPPVKLRDISNPTQAEMRRLSVEQRKKKKHREETGLSLRQKCLREAEDDRIVDQLCEDMGEKEALEAFEYGDDPRLLRLMEMLRSPAYADKSIKQLYRKVGLTMFDVVEVFRKYGWARAIVKGAQGAPKVMEGAVEDALPKTEGCPQCNGKGWIFDIDKDKKEVTLDCPKCRAKGTIRIAGDKESKKAVFESIGVLKPPQTNIAIQNNMSVPPMEQLVRGEIVPEQITEGEDGGEGKGWKRVGQGKTLGEDGGADEA